ncbi:hypothetical protein [Verrucomicrobium sp. BvORR034]|uniref:hypothetical protein n=1 Tax=Verrucomicrobium sp. BvORR034 TaxID=1396418 RepID=UPI000679588E|nr:hypothetical protein [Verrucomicrobium sp. BvORR034]
MEAQAPLIPEVATETVRLSTLEERWSSSTALSLEEMVLFQRENAQPELETDPLELWVRSLASSPDDLS